MRIPACDEDAAAERLAAALPVPMSKHALVLAMIRRCARMGPSRLHIWLGETAETELIAAAATEVEVEPEPKRANY
tara:strand:- start:1948 stop:2175 length:228 start_codon:yes stop_codon:yes gene_type:complete